MSEPPKKIIRQWLGVRRCTGLANYRNKEQEEVKELFVVRLCCDVFVEVLCYGNRCRLAKLEHIGRRFHFGVKNFFAETPSLRLNFQLELGNKWECFIAYNERKKIVDDMTKLPQFLRFDGVKLCLWSLVTSRHSIVNKCQLLVKYFQPHKKALNDTNLIHFDGITIDDARLGFFTDHSQFLNCLRRDLLPIFDKSRDYKFKIHFYSDRNSGANLIASMLQMDPIKRCSNLEILLYGLTQPTELPTDAISNWLNRESDGINKYSKERCLQISLGNIQTAQHLIDHLKATFKEANFAVRPFTFELNFCLETGAIGIHREDGIVTNKRTNEILSIRKNVREIEINRKRDDHKKDSKMPS